MVSHERWLDAEAGPVVRPYALTRGRARPAGEPIDLIAVITADRRASPDALRLDPAHFSLLKLLQQPASVADLATGLDLPVGVVQVLLADLRHDALITIHNPIPPARLPDLQVLKDVVEGLRRL